MTNQNEFLEDNVLDHWLLGQGGLGSVLDTRQRGLEQYKNGCLKDIASGRFGRIYTLVENENLIFKVFRCPNNNLTNRSHDSFTTQRENRQMMISQYLNEHYNDLKKYFVRFTYYNNAICLPNDERLPLIIMNRVVGTKLGEYIGGCITKHPKKKLKTLADEWLELSKFLTRQNIAHGDLQSENIFVMETFENKKVQIHIQLVDYDGMYVPTMRNNFKGKGTECGIANYQHPKRIERDNYFSKNMDNFSMLSIYLGLLALIENPERWKNHDENSIYFTESDYLNPEDSQRFKDLGRSSNPLIRELTRYLVKVLEYASWNNQQHPTIDDIKSLTELIDEFEVSHPTQNSKPNFRIVRRSGNREEIITNIKKDPLIVANDSSKYSVRNCTWYIDGYPISQNIELGTELYSYLEKRNLLDTEISVSAMINDSSISVPEKKYILNRARIPEINISLKKEGFFIVEYENPNIAVTQRSWYINGKFISNDVRFGTDKLKKYYSDGETMKITASLDLSNGNCIAVSLEFFMRMNNHKKYILIE